MPTPETDQQVFLAAENYAAKVNQCRKVFGHVKVLSEINWKLSGKVLKLSYHCMPNHETIAATLFLHAKNDARWREWTRFDVKKSESNSQAHTRSTFQSESGLSRKVCCSTAYGPLWAEVRSLLHLIRSTNHWVIFLQSLASLFRAFFAARLINDCGNNCFAWKIAAHFLQH